MTSATGPGRVLSQIYRAVNAGFQTGRAASVAEASITCPMREVTEALDEDSIKAMAKSGTFRTGRERARCHLSVRLPPLCAKVADNIVRTVPELSAEIPLLGVKEDLRMAPDHLDASLPNDHPLSDNRLHRNWTINGEQG